MDTAPDFESIKHINIVGDEYWSARDLMLLLGYGANSWHNFQRVLAKAMTSCQEAGLAISDHFYAVKMVKLGSGAERSIEDYFLTKHACYVIAQNGDPRKPQIAAQQYFAFAGAVVDDLTRLRAEQGRRLQLRLKVADGNMRLPSTALSSGVQPPNMPLFHDAGYHGLCGIGVDLCAYLSTTVKVGPPIHSGRSIARHVITVRMPRAPSIIKSLGILATH